MKTNVFHTIEEKQPSFSKGKQRIASYILENPNDAAFQTAAQIGKSVKISESTVVRFAGDLGYKGFPEFQKALQKEVKARLQKDASLSSESSMEPLPGKRSADTSLGEDFLYSQLQPLNPSAAKDAAAVLSHCHKLCILATPLGSLVAPFCRYAGEMLLEAVTDLPLDSKDRLFAAISRIMPGDTVLALALGEISSLYLFAVEQCKKMGARILVITDSMPELSLFSEDLTLMVSRVETGGVPDVISVMQLLGGLFTLCENHRAQGADSQKKILKEIWDTYDKFKT